MRKQDFSGEVAMQQLEGVVMRKVPYSGSSAVVSIYTREHGTAAFMARGGGKGVGLKAFFPLARLSFVSGFRENKQVQNLSQVALRSRFSSAYFDPRKAAVSMFLAEVLWRSLREESPDGELYAFIDSALDRYEREEYHPDFHLVFMLGLTVHLGFKPSGAQSAKCPYFDLLHGEFTDKRHQSMHMLEREEAAQLHALLRGSAALSSHAVRRKLLHAMSVYFALHLEGFGEVKSLQVLEAVFR